MASTFPLAILCVNLFLHATISSPIEIDKQHDLESKLTEVKGEIDELYKRLNTLTGPHDASRINPVQSYHNSLDQMCLSKECVDVSHRLFHNMNTSANPCEDFYQFSCGNYIKDTIIPDDKGRMSSSFSPLQDIIEVRGRQLLEEQDSPDSFEIDHMSRRWYKACMNETQIEELGVNPLLNSLKKLGGWPVLHGDEVNYDSFKWYEQTRKLNIEGFSVNSVMAHQISSDAKNNSYRVLQFDQASLGMRREYLINGFEDKYVKSYYKYMVDAAILLGGDEEISKQELKESLLFEIDLANLSAPREERRDETKLYNPTTLGQLDNDEAALEGDIRSTPPWEKYIAGLVYDGASITERDESNDKAKNIVINSDEKVIIRNPSFFKNFTKLISKTNPKVVANYMAWRVVQSRMEYLNKNAQDIVQTYNKALTGIENSKPRWKKCVESAGFNSFSIQSGAGMASSMYVRRFFKPEEKEVMENMITYVRKYFAKMLSQLTWMDENTKIDANKKLEKMDQFIAYPDELLDKKTIDGLHKGLQISDNFYTNILQRAKFWSVFEYRRLREKIDPKDWIDHQAVALVNAFYNPETNSMIFPAGILQGIFFDSKVPKYMNFGSIGVVIGHEITHGFDDRGRRRNHIGVLKDWWAKSTAEEYVKRAQCMVEKYGNYTAKQVGMAVNGVTSQGENIADNGGIKESYGAYLQWVEDQKRLHQDAKWEEKILPGHAFTPKQLFWVSYGQLWCQKFRDDALRNTIKTGVHMPGEFRIIGPLSNSDDFAKDFNCPIGSPMNPERKCRVW